MFVGIAFVSYPSIAKGTIVPLLTVFAAGFVLAAFEGIRFDRLLRKLGLLCPACGARLAGTLASRAWGALDAEVRRTGCCHFCHRRVIAQET